MGVNAEIGFIASGERGYWFHGWELTTRLVSLVEVNDEIGFMGGGG